MPEGGASTRNVQGAKCRRCDLENIVGRPEYYIIRETSTRKEERRGKLFTEDQSRRLQYVYFSAVFDSLSNSAHLYILGNKRKTKKKSIL